MFSEKLIYFNCITDKKCCNSFSSRFPQETGIDAGVITAETVEI
jgi:hypothetical protein